MSIVDALSRITEIQANVATLQGGGAAAAAQAQAITAVPGTSSLGTGGAAPASFASTLAQLQPAGVVASDKLTPGQQQFAARLAAQTGLDPRVISAWLLAEESSGAAKSREAAGNHNWLNIGYTDSGTYGSGNSIWSNPITAADATAGWLKGQDTVAGYGKAAPGVQAILRTAGQPPDVQIAALQRSGWASSGYPDLPALLQMVSSG